MSPTAFRLGLIALCVLAVALAAAVAFAIVGDGVARVAAEATP